MSEYRRPPVTGAIVFFTVTLAARGGDVLVREVGLLRDAVRVTRAERPFGIEAWVVLPDHIHAVWQMPPGDRAYGVRWGAIKARFTRAVQEKYGADGSGRRVGFHPTDGAPVGPGMVGWNPTLRSASKIRKGDAGLWQRRFWGETRFRHSRMKGPVDLSSVERAEPRRRSRPHPRRGGLLGACAVLLAEPGKTRVRRAAGGLAVFVGPSGWAVCAGDGFGDVG